MPGEQDASPTRTGGRHIKSPSISGDLQSPLRADCKIGLRVQGMQRQEAGPGKRPLAPTMMYNRITPPNRQGVGNLARP